MKLKNVLIVVSDIEKSKAFYKDLFGLDVIADFDGNVVLTEGLALQDKKIWERFIERKVVCGGNDAELYFEENDIDAFLEKLENSQYEIEYLNKCIEHDWGQRVIRLHDPDKHVIEIAESMEYVARRFLKTGMNAEQTAEKTQLPLSQVEKISHDKRTIKSSELISNGLLKGLEDNDFDKVYTLMDMSFPDDEHRSYVEQKKLLNNSKYIIYVVPDNENDDIKAFITVYRFEDFAFVEHFAVNPNYRNQGIGSLILKELKKILRCRICLEVELPKTENAKKRISFYERNGFYLNRYPYVQPPFSEDKHEIPLLVMTTGQAVEVDEFEQIKKVLFKEVYHIYE